MSQFPLDLKHFEMLKVILTYRFAHKGRGTGRPSLHATGMRETRLAYNPPSLSFDTEPARTMHAPRRGFTKWLQQFIFSTRSVYGPLKG